jgi:hypothetical protein
VLLLSEDDPKDCGPVLPVHAVQPDIAEMDPRPSDRASKE